MKVMERFFRSREEQDAVIRRLEIIREAVKQIPAEVEEGHLEVPWRRMAGMRDVSMHVYFGVDLELTWRTATEDVRRIGLKALVNTGVPSLGRFI